MLLLALLASVSISLLAQSGTIRGNIYETDTGEPIMFASLYLKGTTYGTTSDINGFFTLSKIPTGDYTLVATYVGFDSATVEITLTDNKIVNQQLYLEASGVQLGTAEVTGEKEQARTEPQVSKLTVSPQQIKSLPSIGGQADIAQFLPVLPGVIFTGDQGGQIYIRGGSPVQTLVQLDGMTIYNPFHSIGFFSVFETEIVRSLDVYTGGFAAEFGGRASAVLDIKTREGNRKNLSGLVSVNPFQAKAIIEGPIVKLTEDNGTSLSFILAGKQSLINQTSKSLYSYAVDTALYSIGVENAEPVEPEEVGLPYNFTDLYGKISLVSNNGSRLNIFGFNFEDELGYPSLDLDWNAFGAGTNFNLVPGRSGMVIDGSLTFSDYKINLKEGDDNPRTSRINNFTANFNFTSFGNESEVKYGVQIRGMSTELTFRNFANITIDHKKNTTELAGYVKYRKKFGPLVIEPSFRLHFYASLNELSPEPRLGLKYNVTDWLRIKFGGGLYSQNLISTSREDDIVNLFVGFITDPEERFKQPGTDEDVNHKLQKAVHAVGGVEVDLTNRITVNVEPYYKEFTQLVNLNRNKLSEQESDYATETGDAYGIDFLTKYKAPRLDVWLSYSLGYVTRFDGEQEYNPVFDRRHNANFVVSYRFGSKLQWEASSRYNYGSGLPFTQVQGFYGFYNLAQEGIQSDVLEGNADLQPIYAEERNGGRLPAYSRWDLSLKYEAQFSERSSLEVVASVTNATDRDNIFFFYILENQRINQLPILPSMGLTLTF